MTVEDAGATYDRHRTVFGLIVRGIETVAAARHAAPGAKRRRERHANVFAGEIRADLLDWLEPRLPAGWTVMDIANSGIELHGPGGIVICVRRPDADGSAPEARSERRGQIYRQQPLFLWNSEGEPESALTVDTAMVMTIVATWGYDYRSSEVWLQLSAPSSSDTWYWSEVDIDLTDTSVSDQLDEDGEEHDDPLGDEDTGEEESSG
jgi:hypothetical protein